jgi:Mn-containing catalase
MPHNALKIQIKEEFYYSITHVSIDSESELLIAYLVDRNAYRLLISLLKNLASVEFKITVDEEKLCVTFSENNLRALTFLRERDLFSENSYQRAIEELGVHTRKVSP